MGSQSPADWSVSFCGLNCAKCDMYEAAHGNERLMAEIIEWFKKERNEDIRPEQIRCEGCKGALDVHWSADCKIMLCGKQKAVEYCFQCREFPCEVLNSFASDGISHHKRTVENLKQMKQIGINEWIAEQEKSGKCVFCP